MYTHLYNVLRASFFKCCTSLSTPLTKKARCAAPGEAAPRAIAVAANASAKFLAVVQSHPAASQSKFLLPGLCRHQAEFFPMPVRRKSKLFS